jgi:uroporphyrinogen III methyltransferase/synthase
MHLQGRRVLITRAPAQAAELAEAFRRKGALPVCLPLIEIGDPRSWAECDAALRQLPRYRGIVFTSANAVEGFFGRVRALGLGPEALAHCSCHAVGEATREAILRHRPGVERLPASATGEALGGMFEGRDLKGERYLHPRGSLGRDDVALHLRRAGAEVDVVEVYAARAVPAAALGELVREIRSGRLDVVTFLSPSALQAFAAAFPAAEFQRLACRPLLAVIGPTTADAAAREHLPADAVARVSTSAGLVEAVEELLRTHAQ